MVKLDALVDDDDRNASARVVGLNGRNVDVKAKVGPEVPLAAIERLIGRIGRLNANRMHNSNGVLATAMPQRACTLSLWFALFGHCARCTSTKSDSRRPHVPQRCASYTKEQLGT